MGLHCVLCSAHFSVDILLNPSKHSLVLLAHPLLSHPCTVARDSSAEQKKGNAVSFQLINVPREDVLRTSCASCNFIPIHLLPFVGVYVAVSEGQGLVQHFCSLQSNLL